MLDEVDFSDTFVSFEEVEGSGGTESFADFEAGYESELSATPDSFEEFGTSGKYIDVEESLEPFKALSSLLDVWESAFDEGLSGG